VSGVCPAGFFLKENKEHDVRIFPMPPVSAFLPDFGVISMQKMPCVWQSMVSPFQLFHRSFV
jgi:hypothetical protein